MTVTPPPAKSVVVVVIGDTQLPSGNPATLWIGDYSTPVAAGRSTTVHVTASGGPVRFQGNNSYSGTSSFSGTVFTMPFPG